VWREVRDWVEELACRAGFDGLPGGGRGLAVAAAIVAALAVGYLALNTRGSTVQLPRQDEAPSSAATASADPASIPTEPATITVHVVGEVRHPGVYALPSGARAIDAVEAAGGLLGDAEQAAVNLARPIADGEQIAVPRQGDVVAGAASGTTGAGGSAAAGGKIDLNTASAEQLDTLPGVGPSTAAKIVADRTANGPFRTVDDLMRVPGIGPAKLEALKDLVTAG